MGFENTAQNQDIPQKSQVQIQSESDLNLIYDRIANATLRLEELNSDIKKAEELNTNIVFLHAQYDEKKKEFDAFMETMAESQAGENAKLDEIQSNTQSSADTYSALSEQIAAMHQEYTKISGLLTDLVRQRDDLLAEIKNLEDSRNIALDKSQETSDSLKAKIATLLDQEATLNISILNLNQRFSDISATVYTTEENIKSRVQALNDATEQYTNIIYKIEEANKQLDTVIADTDAKQNLLFLKQVDFDNSCKQKETEMQIKGEQLDLREQKLEQIRLGLQKLLGKPITF